MIHFNAENISALSAAQRLERQAYGTKPVNHLDLATEVNEVFFCGVHCNLRASLFSKKRGDL